MEILVLGSGCPNCKKLEANVRKACDSLGLKAEIGKVQEYGRIASYGVMRTPALVVGGEVKVCGRVPEVEEIKRVLLAV